MGLRNRCKFKQIMSFCDYYLITAIAMSDFLVEDVLISFLEEAVGILFAVPRYGNDLTDWNSCR